MGRERESKRRKYINTGLALGEPERAAVPETVDMVLAVLHVETKLDVLKTDSCRAEQVDLAFCDESGHRRTKHILV